MHFLQVLNYGGLRSRLWVKSGQGPVGAKGAMDISPVQVRNNACNWVLGMIVGQPRRIAPFLTHDHRYIPCGGITQVAWGWRVAQWAFDLGGAWWP